MTYTKVSKSKIGGRGVFAVKYIPKGTVFLINEAILTKNNQHDTLVETCVSEYWYEWKGNVCAIAAGHGSFFNHSYKPNAGYEVILRSKKIKYTALKNIEIGEEITINYNGDPISKKKLWFHCKGK